jgi:hypothetical protein
MKRARTVRSCCNTEIEHLRGRRRATAIEGAKNVKRELEEIVGLIEARAHARPTAMEFEMAYQARVAMGPYPVRNQTHRTVRAADGSDPRGRCSAAGCVRTTRNGRSPVSAAIARCVPRRGSTECHCRTRSGRDTSSPSAKRGVLKTSASKHLTEAKTMCFQRVRVGYSDTLCRKQAETADCH